VLDNNTCLGGTPVWPTAEAAGEIVLVEEFEKNLWRKVLWWTKARELPAPEALPLDVQHADGFYHPSAAWSVPTGTSPTLSPKGNRLFRFDFLDPATSPGGARRRGPRLTGSGLGDFTFAQHQQGSNWKADFKIPTHVGGAGGGLKREPQSHTDAYGTFTAAVDPEVSVSLLLPGAGLEEYLVQCFLHMVHELDVEGGAVDGLLRNLVPEATRLVARATEVRIAPANFYVEAGGLQDLVVTADGPPGFEFPMALRFEGADSFFVTDLVTLTSNPIDEADGLVWGDGVERSWEEGGLAGTAL
jgi:hypothetical protein